MHRLYTYVLAAFSYSSTSDATTPIAPLRYDVLAKPRAPISNVQYQCTYTWPTANRDQNIIQRTHPPPTATFLLLPAAPPMMRCIYRIFHYPSKHPESNPRALLFTSPRFPNTFFHSPPQPPICSPSRSRSSI